MFTHDPRRRVRRVLLASSTAVSLVLAGAVTASASADTPAGWEKAPDVSAFQFLLVLFLIPVGIGLVVALLASLPSFARDRGYEPGQAWRGESAWFGGPTKGVHASDDVSHEQIEASSQGTGGTSGRW